MKACTLLGVTFSFLEFVKAFSYSLKSIILTVLSLLKLISYLNHPHFRIAGHTCSIVLFCRKRSFDLLAKYILSRCEATSTHDLVRPSFLPICQLPHLEALQCIYFVVRSYEKNLTGQNMFVESNRIQKELQVE